MIRQKVWPPLYSAKNQTNHEKQHLCANPSQFFHRVDHLFPSFVPHCRAPQAMTALQARQERGSVSESFFLISVYELCMQK